MNAADDDVWRKRLYILAGCAAIAAAGVFLYLIFSPAAQQERGSSESGSPDSRKSLRETSPLAESRGGTPGWDERDRRELHPGGKERTKPAKPPKKPPKTRLMAPSGDALRPWVEVEECPPGTAPVLINWPKPGDRACKKPEAGK